MKRVKGRYNNLVPAQTSRPFVHLCTAFDRDGWMVLTPRLLPFLAESVGSVIFYSQLSKVFPESKISR